MFKFLAAGLMILVFCLSSNAKSQKDKPVVIPEHKCCHNGQCCGTKGCCDKKGCKSAKCPKIKPRIGVKK
jgi:hypothetical protein